MSRPTDTVPPSSRRRHARRYALSVLFSLLLGACGQGASPENADGEGVPAPAPPFQLTSAAFKPGGAIPRDYTCEGANTPPPLAWGTAPEGTRSLALIVENTTHGARPPVHWIVYNLSPARRHLDPGAADTLSGTEARQALNDFGQARYHGPCPADGDGPQTYAFRLYALDHLVDTLPPDRRQLLAVLRARALMELELLGTY